LDANEAGCKQRLGAFDRTAAVAGAIDIHPPRSSTACLPACLPTCLPNYRATTATICAEKTLLSNA